ncbi:MAG TPA: nucleoside deaminase [Bacteroidia bacterium]|nr:nucleoside deaminase [Bacteroidia bacterium]HNT79967.1 nucleoside deaminase [Bacteroidia bacterium]
MDHEHFLHMAIKLAREGMKEGKGGPFGALVVKNGSVIGKGANNVLYSKDPTAHAEICAIRMAAETLKDFDLSGSIIYSSCEPCPMCLGAILWARIDALYFAAGRDDAAEGGFDDSIFYQEVKLNPSDRSLKSIQLLQKEGKHLFTEWNVFPEKKIY